MTVFTVDEARRAEAEGRSMKFLFFWGHQTKAGSGVGAECLSQWAPTEFTVDDQRYATAEHYMMRRKAILFGDTTTAARILGAASPGEAKKLGRTVRGFDESIWAAHRDAIVLAANVAKFGQDPRLREFLLGTGGRVLVEASPLDRIWGIGLAATDARAGRPSQWLGLNLLGFALMRARDTLRT